YRRDDREIIRTGKTKTIVEDYIERGTSRTVQTVKTPVLGDDGKPIGVLGIFWDITESKRMENKLIQNEQIARERARFLSDLRDIDEFDDILTRVCQAVHDSSLFHRAVMTLNKPGGEIIHLGQVGLPNAEIKRARRAPPLSSKLRTQITNKRFRISDSFFVPVEAGLNFSKTSRYIPQKRKGSISGDWQIGDELFIPLRDFSGKTMGYLSVDTPFDGCRPERDKIEALEMLVEAAASRIREVQAQKAVKREADFSQSIIETANSLIICLDHEARITAFNKECERITGYRSQEVLGKKWPEMFLPPEYRHKKLKSFTSWVRAHPRDQYEGPIKTKTGEIRTILWSNTAIFGSREKDLIAIAIGQDITDRKMAEGALRESEEKWRSLVKNAPNIIMIVNRNGTIQFINRTVSSLTIEETVGKSIYDYIEPEYHKVVRETIRRVFRTGESGSYQIKGTGPDKSTAWYETHVGPILQNGQVIAATQITTDITERKRGEEVLRESEETAQAMLNASHDGVLLINPDGTIVALNEVLTKRLGWTQKELVGTSVFDILPPDIAQQRMNQVKKVIRSKKPVRFEDKREGRFFDQSAYPVLDSQGKVVRCAVFIHDITERKKSEEEIKQQAKKLAAINAISTTAGKSIELGQVLQVALEKTMEMLKLAAGAIYLLDENSEELVMKTHKNLPRQFVNEVARVKLRNAKFLDSPLRTGKVLTVNDLSQHPGIAKITKKEWHNSVAIVPLKVKNRILGNMNLLGHPGKPFTSDDIAILEAVSHQIGIAIDNAILYDQAQTEIMERKKTEEALQL
ncbi:MAG: PAS domain S-box protein, partial [Candidatus Hodarchaeota archaeon]